MANSLRLFGAWSGLLLWAAYPFVEWQGSTDVFWYRCRLEPATEYRDPCFTDYIPLVEMLSFVVTIALAYPFARFAFSIYAKPSDRRGRGWWLAGRSGGAEYYPSFQVAAGLGILWVALHAKNYPIALYQYHIYWAAWLAWFAGGIRASWPRSCE